MASTPPQHRLHQLIGHQFSYGAADWVLIDVLYEEDYVVIQRLDNQQNPSLQADQYGQAHRRCNDTAILSISDKETPDHYSKELLALLQGRH
jgi:hypothetical protein